MISTIYRIEIKSLFFIFLLFLACCLSSTFWQMDSFLSISSGVTSTWSYYLASIFEGVYYYLGLLTPLIGISLMGLSFKFLKINQLKNFVSYQLLILSILMFSSLFTPSIAMKESSLWNQFYFELIGITFGVFLLSILIWKSGVILNWLKQLKVKRSVSNIVPEVSIAPVIEKIQAKKEEIKQDIVESFSSKKESVTEIENVSKKQVPLFKKKKEKNTFFKSEDLIRTLKQVDPNPVKNPDQAYFNEIISCLEEKLGEFRVDGRIINILKGPVVDTFELELGPGIRVSKVTTIQDDLSLALSGAPIRIVYPMKGRTTIGIEVPRNPREVILLDEVLKSNIFMKSKMLLPVCMGKNAFGDAAVVDLAKMPHMLVAGATGAGKSVFINTLLVSLLVKKSPRQMKLILIDPKQLELAQYAKLPHLCLPVVTEPKLASISLLWAVEEMERRYTILKEMGVRNIEGFNEKVAKASPSDLGKIHQYYTDADENGYEVPYIVIIIDEFADLILTKQGKDIEACVCRLAAKARAAGIHIVLATQRPSVDVITGLIKNNFPTRVSFRVTSGQDSKTILTKVGAEKLLGMGDMLYKHGIEMQRMHSAYVDENEVDLLVEKLESLPSTYSSAAMDFIEKTEESEAAEAGFFSGESKSISKDASMFDQALDVVLTYRQASASMLQRRLRIGYNRAANLVDEMEEKGIIGPAQGSKPREVLISSKEEIES